MEDYVRELKGQTGKFKVKNPPVKKPAILGFLNAGEHYFEKRRRGDMEIFTLSVSDIQVACNQTSAIKNLRNIQYLSV